MTAAITFHDVHKSYRGTRTYRALRDEMMAGAKRLVGIRRPPREAVVALDGVSFEVPVGESFALIGLNGAGKSTALKIATRVSYPTTGTVSVRGRVGALIEVGTGMHPELTGRENIRLYGRILGLSGRQVASRFDEIVDFAGVAAAIDRPVKQYSSGMQLRLGFSVAAHLEPDVLLVDEAIAVGDASFQYRCVERMAQLVREGRTLIFVSHDLGAVERLCNRAILLDEGRVAFDGPAREAVRKHLLNVHAERVAMDARGSIQGRGVLIERVALLDEDGHEAPEFRAGRPMTARIHYVASRPIQTPSFAIGLMDGRLGALSVATTQRADNGPEVISGSGYAECTFEQLPLLPRAYELWGSIYGDTSYSDLVPWQRLRLFRVVDADTDASRSSMSFLLQGAPVTIPHSWGFSPPE
jgi:ABC-type polysaccharide/polyol phosphate transport system ATPase subunit